MLTREYILSLEAGRETDKLVNEKLFGYIVRTHGSYAKTREELDKFRTDFSPSDYVPNAWEVVRKMAENGWMLYHLKHTLNREGSIDGFSCIFLNIESGASREGKDEKAPLEICRAALLTTIQGEE